MCYNNPIMKELVELIRPPDMLKALRAEIPFLKLIPDRIYLNLDTSEFYLPSGDVAKARAQLEEQLEQHVMTYKRGIFNAQIPLVSHLCANIAGAELSSEKFAALHRYEQRFHERGVNFVVYAKPLKLINPENSAMGKHYKELGLSL